MAPVLPLGFPEAKHMEASQRDPRVPGMGFQAPGWCDSVPDDIPGEVGREGGCWLVQIGNGGKQPFGDSRIKETIGDVWLLRYVGNENGMIRFGIP